MLMRTIIICCVIVWQYPCTQSFKVGLNPSKSLYFAEEFLLAHNFFRNLHGAEPLSYDNQLNVEAQKWATYLAENDVMMHSSNDYGENIHRMKVSNPDKQVITGFKPVTSWYSEIDDYDFNTGRAKPSGSMVGHFTQLVWKNSKWLGVGVAMSRSNRIYVVANYFPAGNYGGKYKVNVFPAQTLKND